MPDEKPTGLALLRAPFPPNQVSKLPKPTKWQTDEVKADFKKGVRCAECGQWHHPQVVHLDYVGHAALTDRLLDCDPEWNWEPVARQENGLPALDSLGGLWINLTVCGVTRLGYGNADGKKGGDAIKELIGDALRNAAMRFGAALDLWHKGDLHVDDDADDPPKIDETAALARSVEAAKTAIQVEASVDGLSGLWQSLSRDVKSDPGVIAAKDAQKAELTRKPSDSVTQDEIPY